MSRRDRARRGKEKRRRRATAARRIDALSAFRRALDREIGSLSRRPDLLWTQLFNRLQWEPDPVSGALAPQLRRRTAPGAAPWLRSRTRYRESGALLRTLVGHRGSVRDCAFAPDGATLVSIGGYGELVLWDAETGRELASAVAYDGTGLACAAVAEGELVISAGTKQGGDRTLLALWDWELEGAIATLGEHAGRVTAIDVTADGSRAVSSSEDGSLVLWDLKGRRELARIQAHAGKVETCAFDPGGSLLLSAGEDGRLELWDGRTGEDAGTLVEPFRIPGLISDRTLRPRKIRGCAFSPDGARVLASIDDEIQMLDVESAEVAATLPGGYRVGRWAYSPDGEWIVGCHDHVLTVWNAATGEEVETFEGHASFVRACAFSPDGERIASAGDDGTVRIWEAVAGRAATAKHLHARAISLCVHSPDGLWVATAEHGYRDPLAVWDAESAEVLLRLEHGLEVTACAFRPDGARLVTGSSDRTLKVWDLETGAEIASLHGHEGPVVACAYSPDGSRIVSAASNDRRLVIWDAETGKRSSAIKTGAPPHAPCAFSPDGTRILTLEADGVVLRDAETGRPLTTIEAPAVSTCAFSPDGARIASGDWGGRVALWDAQSGEEVARLAGDDYRLGVEIHVCAFTPDGDRIVVGGADRTLGVREVATGREVAAIVLPGTPLAISHHPHAPQVTVGDAGGNVYRLDLAAGAVGPVVVTAVRAADQALLRCPACWRSFPADPAWLGREIPCPAAGCGRAMRVNPFVVAAPGGRSSLVHRLTGLFTR